MSYLMMFLSLSVAVAGVFGLVEVLRTRADAFEAINRQTRNTWAMILGACVVLVLLRVPFIWFFAIVGVGVYFFDVRPAIKDILSGNRY